MNVQELRIGNLVTLGSHNEDFQKVEGLTWDMVKLPDSTNNLWIHKSMIYGIPLTPEILEMSGFENWGKFYKHLPFTVYAIHNAIDGTSTFEVQEFRDKYHPSIDRAACCWSEFKYLHQLQNLYFALTGNELEVKL